MQEKAEKRFYQQNHNKKNGVIKIRRQFDQNRKRTAINSV
jgi:hypothetical protein